MTVVSMAVSQHGINNICDKVERLSGKVITEEQRIEIFKLSDKYADTRSDIIFYVERVTGLVGFYS